MSRSAAFVGALALMALALPAGSATADLTDPAPLCGTSTAGTVGEEPPPAVGALRIGTINVLHGLTEDGDATLEVRLPIQIAQLAASGADVIGLQEVGESTNHGRVIERLAEGMRVATGDTWHWCWFRTEPHAPGVPDTGPGGGDPLSDLFAQFYNSNDSPWYEGAAVLSRYPIIASAAHRLPGEDVPGRLTGECIPAADPTCVLAVALEPRAALWARVQTPSGPVSVVAAHTSGNALQHRDLARWASERSAADAAAFVLCDCNTTPGSSAYDTLVASGWVDAATLPGGDAGPTADQDIHADHPTVQDRIDYVWFRSDSLPAPAPAERFMDEPSDGLWPSDHYGVITAL